jgi:hypothetical protein
MLTVRSLAIGTTLALSAAISTGPAEAKSHISVNLGFFGAAPVYAAPSYYAPAPVYVPAPPSYYYPPAVVVPTPPAYYAPPQVYYAPSPIYAYPGPIYWRHHRHEEDDD